MKEIKKVSLGVIFYKNLQYIKPFLETVFNQDFKWEIEYIFRDQDPEWEAYFYIQKNFPEYFEKIKFFRSNWWFHSEWHNFLIKKSEWDLYFCLSNDMIYEKNAISKFVEFFSKKVPGLKTKNSTKTEINEDNLVNSPGTVVATCKIKRWDFWIYEELWDLEKSKSNFIDTLWVTPRENHSFFDLWQWEIDNWQYDKLEKTFWPSWAFFVCDRKFFSEENNFFDEKNLPHYKNDCDFSYKLNWMWIETKIIKWTEVYHDRQLWEKNKYENISGFFWKIKELKERDIFFLWDSLKWHLNLLAKNFTCKFPLKIKIKTILFELKRFIFFAIFKPKLLKIYKDFYKNFWKVEKNFSTKSKNFSENMENILKQMK